MVRIRTRPRLRIKRKGHTRKLKSGRTIRIKASGFFTEDKGKKGRTPKPERFFKPRVKSGWRKSDPTRKRRATTLKAHKQDKLATARSLQALSNVSTDRETKKLAKRDADFFFAQHKRGK